jgi:hypothetical protein
LEFKVFELIGRTPEYFGKPLVHPPAMSRSQLHLRESHGDAVKNGAKYVTVIFPVECR